MIYDVGVLGGGVIGLSVAWRLAAAGRSVVVMERGKGPSGASWVAAGMLAPVTEAAYGEEELLQLNLEAAANYPAFMKEVAEASSITIEDRVPGTLFVALDNDQKQALRRLYEYQESLGLQVQWINAKDCRDLEPCLHPSTRAGVLAPGDKAVDPRLLLEGLEAAAVGAGVALHVDFAADRIQGHDPVVVTAGGAEPVRCSSLVLAAGCWSGRIAGAPAEVRSAIRPVKGQILRLRPLPGAAPLISHVIRTEDVYLVPRTGGEIVAGATVEEKGYDQTTTAGAVYELLRGADEAVPGIRELELADASAGLRPGTPDNAPLIGATSQPGIYAATGHYRNGVLLAPVTAAAMPAVLAGRPPKFLKPFDPRRFTP